MQQGDPEAVLEYGWELNTLQNLWTSGSSFTATVKQWLQGHRTHLQDNLQMVELPLHIDQLIVLLWKIPEGAWELISWDWSKIKEPN